MVMRRCVYETCTESWILLPLQNTWDIPLPLPLIAYHWSAMIEQPCWTAAPVLTAPPSHRLLHLRVPQGAAVLLGHSKYIRCKDQRVLGIGYTKYIHCKDQLVLGYTKYLHCKDQRVLGYTIAAGCSRTVNCILWTTRMQLTVFFLLLLLHAAYMATCKKHPASSKSNRNHSR